MLSIEYYDGNLNDFKILKKDELKDIIDELKNIYKVIS